MDYLIEKTKNKQKETVVGPSKKLLTYNCNSYLKKLQRRWRPKRINNLSSLVRMNAKLCQKIAWTQKKKSCEWVEWMKKRFEWASSSSFVVVVVIRWMIPRLKFSHLKEYEMSHRTITTKLTRIKPHSLWMKGWMMA